MFSENLQSANNAECMKSYESLVTSNETEYNKMQENIMEICEWIMEWENDWLAEFYKLCERIKNEVYETFVCV